MKAKKKKTEENLSIFCSNKKFSDTNRISFEFEKL